MKAKGWYWLFGIALVILIFLTVWAYLKGDAWIAGLTPIVLTLAAIIAYRQLEHARYTRCAQLLLDVMKWWNSDRMLEGRELIWKMENSRTEVLQLFTDKKEDFYKVLRVAEFGECLGVLVNRRYVEKKDIWLLFEYDWKRWYHDFSGVVDKLKKEDPSDTTFCNFKLLYEELEKIKR